MYHIKYARRDMFQEVPAQKVATLTKMKKPKERADNIYCNFFKNNLVAIALVSF